NNYVLNELIDWSAAPYDPIFRLVFPNRDMLPPDQFERLERAVARGASEEELDRIAAEVRMTLNPHPAGQMEYNVPTLGGRPVAGVQHKYRETVLLFPRRGQVCHAYCTFCFRWPQFIGDEALKFAVREERRALSYIANQPYVRDVLVTGGDPAIMRTSNL